MKLIHGSLKGLLAEVKDLGGRDRGVPDRVRQKEGH